MKKLLTFMIMFGVFLIPRYTTQAYTIDSLDDIAYGGLTYREIFIDSQILNNADFNTNTNWTVNGSTNTYNNGFVTNTGTGSTTGPFLEQNTSSNRANAKMYFVSRFKTLNSALRVETNFYTGANQSILLVSSPVNDLWYIKSAYATNGSGTIYIQNIRHFYTNTTLATNAQLVIDYAYLYDLTSIFGIGNEPNKDVMDFLYQEFQNINLYIQSYNEGEQSTTAYENGYEIGFGEGYLEGVSEDNAYALGYARGLSEGADMETGSSIIVFVVGAIGFIMMIFGFTTKRRIFNLLSVGAFIVLGGLLAQYVGFIIITIGLVIINVYYTFWGDL